jgi:hypothetical protein
MYGDATRRLELLRPARLDIFDYQKDHPNSCNGILTNLENQLTNINIEEVGCSKNAWCS